jgi:hypothetical protein
VELRSQRTCVAAQQPRRLLGIPVGRLAKAWSPCRSRCDTGSKKTNLAQKPDASTGVSCLRNRGYAKSLVSLQVGFGREAVNGSYP